MKNLIKQTWIPIVILGTIIVAIFTLNTVIIPNIPIYNGSWVKSTYTELMYKIELEGTETTLYYFNIAQYLKNLNTLTKTAKATFDLNNIFVSTQQAFPSAPTNVDVIAWLRYIAKIIPNVIIAVINFTLLILLNIIIAIMNFVGFIVVAGLTLLGIPINQKDLLGNYMYLLPLVFFTAKPIQPIPFI